ncbi:MAG: tetratricopeptide repeat protein [Ignavibacteriaceae bacterium]|nr:tetratricopeptide repeat protein [Ignavibacteriaceae bacterium]
MILLIINTSSTEDCCFHFLIVQKNAIKDFSTAVKINSNNINAYKNRGDEYYKTGNYANAIADYSSSILIEPRNVSLYYSRAEAKLGMGEFLSAVVDYTYIISLDQNDATAYYNRGICYANINMKTNACEDFNRAGELGMFEAYGVIKEYCEEKEKPKVKLKK